MGGIWIRSQDEGVLVNAKRLMIEKHWEKDEIKPRYRIVNQVFYLEGGNVYTNDYDLLGVYDTEERAKEILNDIELYILNKGLVFQMPEE